MVKLMKEKQAIKLHLQREMIQALC